MSDGDYGDWVRVAMRILAMTASVDACAYIVSIA